MRKLLITTAISAISATIAAPVMAASATCSVNGGTGLVYTTTATSDGILVATPSSSVVAYYVDNTSGTASNKTSPAPPPPNPYTLVVSGDWCINTTNGDFTGEILYGNYKTQANASSIAGFSAANADGRQTFVGVGQRFAGTGTWSTSVSGDPILNFSFFNTVVNGGGASTQTQVSSSCANGQTSPLGKVCTSFSTASKNWEGLTFEFIFDPTKFYFTGKLSGTDTSGMSISRSTTSINWIIDGIDPPAAVPVPPAAWLFGSGLIGLVGASRRRIKNT